MAYFKVLSQHFPAGTEGNHEIPVRITSFGPRIKPGTSSVWSRGENHNIWQHQCWWYLPICPASVVKKVCHICGCD